MKWEIATALVLMCLLSGCVQPGTSVESTRLASVQIQQYKGEKLSSINDFRENSIKGPQYVNVTSYKLKVTGLVDNPQEYTYDDVLARQHYSKVVQLDCVEGWSVKLLWDGVLVKDLIADARMKKEANTIIFKAYDGYSTSFPLDYVMSKNIMLAYQMNNVTLPPERGYPFELVAEDKWGYKWIKWVTEIELSSDPTYRGYWESRGYSESGDRDKNMFS